MVFPQSMMHDGAAFRMAERVIPQTVIVLRHGIAFGAAGMVAVRQTAIPAASALISAPLPFSVEQRPFFIVPHPLPGP
jgi:hypothetical protein